MPIESEVLSRRELWPPTQVRFSSVMTSKKTSNTIYSGEPRPLLEDIDDNPLTYFLTPAVTDDREEDDDMMDMDDDIMMDFDAGIEDSSQPREIIRSVSPSSLEGLRKPSSSPPRGGGRAMSLEYFDSDVPTTDDEDDDGEDYIRFSPPSSVLSPLRDLALEGLRFRARSPVFGLTANALLSPDSVPAPSPSRRGRTNIRGTRRSGQQTRSLSATRSRPNHLWREPSPDVWSIEEETEEELMMSDAGLDDKAAKPKKKVRFVLPVKE